MTPPLDDLVGSWSLVVRHEQLPESPGEATFSWLPGGHFLAMRSTVEHPEFPDSLSVIGDEEMHYFDSRGVHRVFASSVSGGVWTLYRESSDPFWQRVTCPLGGDVIETRWERSEDEGASWQLDVSLTYTRVG